MESLHMVFTKYEDPISQKGFRSHTIYPSSYPPSWSVCLHPPYAYLKVDGVPIRSSAGLRSWLTQWRQKVHHSRLFYIIISIEPVTHGVIVELRAGMGPANNGLVG